MQPSRLKKTAIAVVAGMMAMSISPLISADTAQVTVDLNTQHYIGDTSELQRNKFFNIHSVAGEAGSAELDWLYFRNELNLDYGRRFFSPFGAINGSPNYPSTEEAIARGQTAIENRESTPFFPFVSQRTVITDHPSSIIVEGSDPIEGARWAADYFEHNYKDGNAPLFYEPMNEPFVHAREYLNINLPEGQPPFDLQGFHPEENERVRRLMSTWFKEIGIEFDNRNLKTDVIGYSSAFPSFEAFDFRIWEGNQKLFMDIAGEYMDGFATHLYDGVNIVGEASQRSGSNTEAILDLIETYSHISYGKVIPHAITEYGGIIDDFDETGQRDGSPTYTAGRSSQEIRSLNHILFQLLERDDRILTSIPFITGIAQFAIDEEFNPFSASILRPDTESIVSGKITNYLPTEKAKFYQLWADVKGHRVNINDSDPDLAVQAFVYGNKLYLALNNYEDGPKDVSLSFVEHANELSHVRVKRLNAPAPEAGTRNFIAATLTDITTESAPSSLTLVGHETVILEYNYNAPISHDGVSRTRTYYSDKHLQEIFADSTIDFAFSNVELEQSTFSFADSMAEGLDFDQSVVDAINPNSIRRLEAILASLERSFSRLLQSAPDTWQESTAYQRLVATANRSPVVQQALQYHYSQNGYNDGDGSATIRMGIGRGHDKSKQPLLKLNGHTIPVPDDWKGYDQITRTEFFGAIDIPVPVKYLKANNTVAFTFPDSAGHVSSVILDVETDEALNDIPVTGIELDQSITTFNNDLPHRLKANVFPENATNKFVTWSSSNPAILDVNEDGIATPKGIGSAEITATTYDGQHTATINIEVEDKATVRNIVVISNAAELQSFDPTDTVTLELEYTTDTDRDVAFELFGPTGFLGLTNVTVPAGSGSTQLTLSFPEDLSPSQSYRIIAALRSVGGDFRTGVDAHVLNNVEVISPFPPPVADPDNLLGINAGFELGSQAVGSGQTTAQSGDWELHFANQPGVSVVVNEESAISGRFGINVDTTGGRGGFLTNDKRVLPQGLLKAGKKYRLTFDVQHLSQNGQSDSGDAYFRFSNFTPGQAFSHATGEVAIEAPGDGTTTSISQEIEVTEDIVDTGNFIQFLFRTGVWNVDNFKLEDITPEAPSTSLLRNANFDFELPLADDFLFARTPLESPGNQLNTAFFEIREDENSIEGRSLYIDMSPTTEGGGNTDLRLQFSPNAFIQEVQPNTKYVLSYDLRVIQGKFVGYMQRGGLTGPAGLNNFVRIPSFGAIGQVQRITRTFEFDATDILNGDFWFNFHGSTEGNPAGGKAYIDNISFEPQAAP